MGQGTRGEEENPFVPLITWSELIVTTSLKSTPVEPTNSNLFSCSSQIYSLDWSSPEASVLGTKYKIPDSPTGGSSSTTLGVNEFNLEIAASKSSTVAKLQKKGIFPFAG